MSHPSQLGRLRLADRMAELEIAPAEGGSLAAFRWREGARTIDWLRPAPAAGAFPANLGACFPLVPYSNRIREARFRFDGRQHQLRPNFGAARHSIHGHGWQHPWDVTAQSATSASLAFRHDGGDWPQPYRAEQHFALVDGTLSLEISVTNEGRGSMPAGLGFHPYFPRTPDCRLTAAVAQMWATDGEVMPTALTAPAPAADPNAGLQPASAPLDNVFTGFAGRAVIDWPEQGAMLTLEADPALAFLVVYTPPHADFFCVEPVSHCTDAANLAAAGGDDTGLKILGPGETFAARLRLVPRWDRVA